MTTGELGRRRYWDSTNWISLLAEDEVDRADICQNILNDMVAGKLTVITSSWTLAEVIRRRHSPGISSDDDQIITGFFRQHDNLVIHDVTRAIAEKARSLSREHRLRPADAVHLATALSSGADVFETWDMGDFSPLRGLVPLEIREPTWEGFIPMDLTN